MTPGLVLAHKPWQAKSLGTQTEGGQDLHFPGGCSPQVGGEAEASGYAAAHLAACCARSSRGVNAKGSRCKLKPVSWLFSAGRSVVKPVFAGDTMWWQEQEKAPFRGTLTSSRALRQGSPGDPRGAGA